MCKAFRFGGGSFERDSFFFFPSPTLINACMLARVNSKKVCACPSDALRVGADVCTWFNL